MEARARARWTLLLDQRHFSGLYLFFLFNLSGCMSADTQVRSSLISNPLGTTAAQNTTETATVAMTATTTETQTGPPTPTFTPLPIPFPSPTPTRAPSPIPSPNVGITDQVLTLTNQYRASNGLSPLAMNTRLTSAAQTYAELMAGQGFFSHTSPDGTTPGDRILSSGYNWSSYGENIAMGYSTPDAVMQAWINSAGHRANILNAGFRDLGIGYAKDGSGAAYWVQDFGSD